MNVSRVALMRCIIRGARENNPTDPKAALKAILKSRFASEVTGVANWGHILQFNIWLTRFNVSGEAASVEILRYKYDADNRLTNRWSKAKGDTKYPGRGPGYCSISILKRAKNLAGVRLFNGPREKDARKPARSTFP